MTMKRTLVWLCVVVAALAASCVGTAHASTTTVRHRLRNAVLQPDAAAVAEPESDEPSGTPETPADKTPAAPNALVEDGGSADPAAAASSAASSGASSGADAGKDAATAKKEAADKEAAAKHEAQVKQLSTVSGDGQTLMTQTKKSGKKVVPVLDAHPVNCHGCKIESPTARAARAAKEAAAGEAGAIKNGVSDSDSGPEDGDDDEQDCVPPDDPNCTPRRPVVPELRDMLKAGSGGGSSGAHSGEMIRPVIRGQATITAPSTSMEEERRR